MTGFFGLVESSGIQAITDATIRVTRNRSQRQQQADASGLNDLRRSSILEIGIVMLVLAWLILLRAVGFQGRVETLLVTVLLLLGVGHPDSQQQKPIERLQKGEEGYPFVLSEKCLQ